ncbi:M20 family metallopeptidase [Glutamicibacter endophyticus]
MVTTTLNDHQTERLHATYKHLHTHPELSMQEHQTAAFIEARLDELGLEHFRCGGTGVVALQRNGEGPVIAFRADTDGLPIAEDTGADYSSTATGKLPDGAEVPVMHGCGHDTHVAAALAAIEALAGQPSAWAGTILWIFQPGEETSQGAAAMVEDGLWDRAPRPEVVFGQHVFPFLSGALAYTSGNAMAMADSLKLTLYGKQSHGSQPQDSVDPIVLGSHIVTRLQSIVSREVSPLSSAVVTCGSFHAGLKENIIPDRAELTLNVRTLTPEVRQQVLAAITRIVNAEAAASGAPQPLIEELYTFPQLYNDPEHTEVVAKVLREELGEAQIHEVPPAMGSEDFGALASAISVPSVYWFFGGTAADDPAPAVNHSPHFLPTLEPTLSTGVRAILGVLGHYVGK